MVNMKNYDNQTHTIANLVENAFGAASQGIKTNLVSLTESTGGFDSVYESLIEAVDEAVEGVAELNTAKKGFKESIKDSKAIQKVSGAVDGMVNWVKSKAKSKKAIELGSNALEQTAGQIETAITKAEEEGETEKVSKLRSLLAKIKSAIKAAGEKLKRKKKDDGETDLTEEADGGIIEGEGNPFDDEEEETSDSDDAALASGGAIDDNDEVENELAKQADAMIESAFNCLDMGIRPTMVMNESSIDSRTERMYGYIIEAAFDSADIIFEAEGSIANKFKSGAARAGRGIKGAGSAILEAIKKMGRVLKETFDKFTNAIKRKKGTPEAKAEGNRFMNMLKRLKDGATGLFKKAETTEEKEKSQSLLNKIQKAIDNAKAWVGEKRDNRAINKAAKGFAKTM